MSDGRELLPQDFTRRMVNWARWKDGGGVHVAISSIYEGDRRNEHREASIPLLIGEAKDTDEAIEALPARYQYPVRQVWLYLGRPSAWHARIRGIDYRTWDGWVRKGHQLLMQEIARRTLIARTLKVTRDAVERAA